MKKRYLLAMTLFLGACLFGVASLGAGGYLIYEYGDPTNGESATGSNQYQTNSNIQLSSVSGSGEPAVLDYDELIQDGTTEQRLGVFVDTSAYSHQISPFVYGINFSDPQTLTELNIPLRRWGGNATTRYNWRTDVSNRGSDWFFENVPNEDTDVANLPASSTSNQFFGETLGLGIDPIITMPMIGWTPSGTGYACGFPTSIYGDQQFLDPFRPECGNGVTKDGAFLAVSDPGIISEPIDETFVKDWIAFLSEQHGSAAEGGIRFFNLDNEPMLWHRTHRDVHPDPVSYAEMKERSITYASAIKEADPNALTLGPVAWGWPAYFNSALDLNDNSARFDNPDQEIYGDQPFVVWYLEQMRLHEEETGTRILDFLDLHYYSEVPGLSLSDEINSEMKRMRFNATRSLWDPTYRDESWINKPIMVIPRMHEWIAETYPGTGTAITEYNFGATNHITGALVQADALGIFGRERLDLATMWSPPTLEQPAAFAFKMYRNYDGNNSTFGDLSLPTGTHDQNRVSVYAAYRQDDGAVTIVLINKSPIVEPVTLTLPDGNMIGRDYTHYLYSEADLSRIVVAAEDIVPQSQVELNLPTESISLIVIQP